MLLALKFGSSLEEQIKALLHDISHSAFSHVIDYVLGNIDKFLKHLVICDNKLYIDSIEMGKWFSELYHKEVTEYISAPLNKYANTMLTKLLKRALKENIIKLSDFELTDVVMM